jgi:glycerol uptake facilitator-like aquaporin
MDIEDKNLSKIYCFTTYILLLIGEGSIANYKFASPTSHSTLSISLSLGVGVYSGKINTNKFTYQNSYQSVF